MFSLRSNEMGPGTFVMVPVDAPLYVWRAKRTPPPPVQLNPPCVSSWRPGITYKFVDAGDQSHPIDEKDRPPIRRDSNGR